MENIVKVEVVGFNRKMTTNNTNETLENIQVKISVGNSLIFFFLINENLNMKNRDRKIPPPPR